MNFHKFTLPSYAGLDNDEAFVNCTNGLNLSTGFMYRNNNFCTNILICILNAVNPSDQAKFSSAATILGLV